MNDKEWFLSACEIDDRKKILPKEFPTSVYDALKDGRNKKNNIVIVGPANIVNK